MKEQQPQINTVVTSSEVLKIVNILSPLGATKGRTSLNVLEKVSKSGQVFKKNKMAAVLFFLHLIPP